jgi:hypothetical protein
MTIVRRRLIGIALVALAAACHRSPDSLSLGAPEDIAPGVALYRVGDESFVNHAGPIAIYLLRLDLTRVRLGTALSNGQVMDAEPVEAIAARVGAIAAVNGSFFNSGNGEPIGLLKVGGELVSDSAAEKGAVVMERASDGATSLAFDRLAAKLSLHFTAGGQDHVVRVDGVDTTRVRGRLMLYTPAYHLDTDTAPTGTEWVLDGSPLRVVDVRMNYGHTRIPPHGAVLSFGGLDLPADLQALVEGVPVTFETHWRSHAGLSPDRLDHAADIVTGAGLLRRAGEVIVDWKDEGLSHDAFVDARHPRTLIGLDRHGVAWLAAIDGRQPSYSIGMTFADMQRLADRLDLSDALNLDGGGSTTMVVKDRVVNKPSDPIGPRSVSDAVVVLPR